VIGPLVPIPDGPTRNVRIPRTASLRGAIAYSKLLRTVEPDAVWGGWRFDGMLLRPGSLIPEADLWPAAGYPQIPLLLECAGPERHRREYLYILWRYDPGSGEFREVARTASENRDWTLDLGPITKRVIDPPRPVAVDPEAVCRRLCTLLDDELGPLNRDARRVVLLAVYDQLAGRVVDLPPSDPTIPASEQARYAPGKAMASREPVVRRQHSKVG
jgi:hypothetical protein